MNNAKRTYANAFIAIVLVFHVVLPLRYYVGGSGNDERFSWRMFSTLQLELATSNVDVAVTEKTTNSKPRVVDVQRVLPEPWIEFLRRGHPVVTDAYVLHRQQDHAASDVRIHRPSR